MTILELIQAYARESGLPAPTSVVGSTDPLAVQLLALLTTAGKNCRSNYRFPELVRDGSFTLVSGQESYPFASDVDDVATLSYWNQTQHLPLYGPMTDLEWSAYKAGTAPISTTQAFRVKGIKDSQIFIAPVPTTSGDVIAYEYQSKNWLRPRTWTSSTAFAANSYCFRNGNIYLTTTGGTSGSTPPTHTSSTASDGGITWAYYSGIYETPTADTDVVLLDDVSLTLELGWRFFREKGLNYAEKRKDAEDAWAVAAGQTKSAGRLRLRGPRLGGIPRPIIPGWS